MVNVMHELCKMTGLLLSLPKTLLFNFHYFPLAQAVKLPVFVSYRTKLRNLGGQVHLEHCSTGLIQIGFGGLGQTTGRQEAVWSMTGGKICFMGKARIGTGAKILVNGGKLTFGESFEASSNLLLMCNKQINIEKDVLLSWNATVMDTDGHTILQKSEQINLDQAVYIDRHVWIGCDVIILKGTHINESSVVGARSLVSGYFDAQSLIAGSPAKAIKKDISWE